MNQEEQVRGQKIASALMKVLAIVGLVAILALAAWVSVQIAKSAPALTDRLVSGVVSLTRENATSSSETTSPRDTRELEMVLVERVIPSGEDFVLAWRNVPDGENATYTLTYGCADSASLLVRQDGVYAPAVCDAPLRINASSSVTIRPISDNNRFLDVPITVRVDSDDATREGRVLVTIENTLVADSRGALSLDDDDAQEEVTADADASNEESTDDTSPEASEVAVVDEDTTDTTATDAGVPVTTPAPQAVVVATPADLRVRIDATGVQAPVNGVPTFFALDEIPTDRVGAVRFTVDNVGGTMSGAWSFKTYLPIDGNRNYEYRPEGEQFLQEGLRPGEGVTFTLAFDQIVEDEQGLIRIELLPTDAGDQKSNNEAMRVVQLRQ